ncbi:MAG: dUTP diphosphatase [Candidatus Diapherotrites archaeon]|nr:dUTP diphosphatase [Candidatus Diapherotrites archaeon]
MRILVKKLRGSAVLPSYAHHGDAGADLYAVEDCVINPGERKLLPTGVSIEVPHGCEAQIRPKSGLALKQGLSIVNTPGTVDAGYRGEIGVIAINLGQEPIEIKAGQKIAQLVINRIEIAEFYETDELSGTSRGGGGYGSTGA